MIKLKLVKVIMLTPFYGGVLTLYKPISASINLDKYLVSLQPFEYNQFNVVNNDIYDNNVVNERYIYIRNLYE